MAVVATYYNPVPGCSVVRIHDDCFAKDQKAAWENAWKVHGEIYWKYRLAELEREEAEREAAKEKAEG